MVTKRKTKTKAQKKVARAKFQQKTITINKNNEKMREAYYAQMNLQQDIIKRATIIESINNARPELSTRIDNKLQLDMNNIELKEDGILYWKADNNPVVSGMDAFENYSNYSLEFVNEILNFLGEKMDERSSDIDLEGFELIENDVEEADIIESSSTEELTTEEPTIVDTTIEEIK